MDFLYSYFNVMTNILAFGMTVYFAVAVVIFIYLMFSNTKAKITHKATDEEVELKGLSRICMLLFLSIFWLIVLILYKRVGGSDE